MIQPRAPYRCASSSKRRIHRATAILIIGIAALLTSCGQIPVSPPAPSSPGTASVESSAPNATPVAADGGDVCEYSLSGTAARPVAPPPSTGVSTSGTISYVLSMTNGAVTITLDRAMAPCTVNSFVSLAEQGYFDDTKCHRLADSGIFILQCGDPSGTGKGGPGYEFANETDGTETYTEGVVAMANGGPGSNGSQFFWCGPTRRASIRSGTSRSSATWTRARAMWWRRWPRKVRTAAIATVPADPTTPVRFRA